MTTRMTTRKIADRMLELAILAEEEGKSTLSPARRVVCKADVIFYLNLACEAERDIIETLKQWDALKRGDELFPTRKRFAGYSW